MTTHYRLYLKIIDRLRARRGAKGWKADDDRGDLAALEDLFEKLSSDEQAVANREGWRSWPDLPCAPPRVLSDRALVAEVRDKIR